ncbi:hypothetical protein [Desulfurobacterium sp.]
MRAFIMFLLGMLTLCGTARANVNIGDDGCLYCHRLKGLSVVEVKENGEKEIVDCSINDAKYLHSVHRNIHCTECHTKATSYPHNRAVVREVNCAAKCHVIDPATKRPFSHAAVYKTWEESVHGKNYKKAPDLYPNCQYCHTNRLLVDIKKFETLEGSFDRCYLCHTNKEWSADRLAHVASRMDIPVIRNGYVSQFVKTRRDGWEIVELCASCHENEKKMEEAIEVEGIHNKYLKQRILEAVDSYEKTMHSKMLYLDRSDTRAADCLDCHTNKGGNFHDIFHKDDPRSSINPRNIEMTCGRSTECHPLAPKYHMKNFAQTKWVHVDPVLGEDLSQTIAWGVEEGMFWMASSVILFAAIVVILDTLKFVRRK